MPLTLASVVRSASSRFGIPICLYPGLQITGATVGDAVRDAGVQCAAQIAMHERFGTPLIHSAMDLSVEAEAFGCEIRFDAGAIPTVAVPLLATPDDIRALAIPSIGDWRTRVSLRSMPQSRPFRRPTAPDAPGRGHHCPDRGGWPDGPRPRSLPHRRSRGGRGRLEVLED
jgi:hypothetical protein